MAITKLVTDSLGAGVGGKVLQVVQGSTASQVAHTTTYADTGLSASITPSSTSNKIFIIVNQHCYTQGNSGGAIKLLRDSTDIYAPGQTFAFYNEIANSHPRNYHNFSKLDSPSSTSSITYKTQARLYSSNAFRTQDGNHFTSFITLMEVSA